MSALNVGGRARVFSKRWLQSRAGSEMQRPNRVPQSGDDRDRTRGSLLLAARNRHDLVACAAFDRQYRPLVQAWCRQAGLTSDDAEELANDILLEVADRLLTFQYDPNRSFRGWLFTVTRWRLADEFRRRHPKAMPELLGGRAEDLVGPAEDAEPLSSELRHLLDASALAQARVQSRINSRNWQLFSAVVMDNTPLSEAARMLGMSYTNAHKSLNRVSQMLREEGDQVDPATQPSS